LNYLVLTHRMVQGFASSTGTRPVVSAHKSHEDII